MPIQPSPIAETSKPPVPMFASALPLLGSSKLSGRVVFVFSGARVGSWRLAPRG